MDFLAWWWEDSLGEFLAVVAIVIGLAWMLVHYSKDSKQRGHGRTGILLLLSIVAVIALIVGLAWLIMALQDWFAGNPIDFGRKVLGVPGYVFWMMSMMAILVRNSVNK